MAPDLYTEYEITDDGVLNPPIIAEYERRLTEASAAGDQTQIELITEDYHDERRRIAERHNEKVRERRNSDDRLLAQERRAAESAAREQAQAAERAREQEHTQSLREQEAQGTGPFAPTNPVDSPDANPRPVTSAPVNEPDMGQTQTPTNPEV